MERSLSNILDLHFQGMGHGIHEAACPCGAFVIGPKVGDDTHLTHFHHPYAVTTYIDHDLYIRIDAVGPFCE